MKDFQFTKGFHARIFLTATDLFGVLVSGILWPRRLPLSELDLQD